MSAQQDRRYEDHRYEDPRYENQRFDEARPQSRGVSQPLWVVDLGARFLELEDFDAQSFSAALTHYSPIGDLFGIALGGDLGFGDVDGNFGEVLGLHGAGFWRDPDIGYIGAAVIFDHVSEIERVNVSALGGIYIQRVDLNAAAGYDGGDGPGLGLFAVELGYYLNDQLRLGGGFDFGTDETLSGGVLIHWQPGADSPMSLRANLAGGELEDDPFYSIGFGITVDFADAKSLRDQLRRDRLLLFD